MTKHIETKRIESEPGWTRGKRRGHPIVCSECGKLGGTLVNVGDKVNPKYIHQDKEKCRIMRL